MTTTMPHHSYTEPVFVMSVAAELLSIHPQTLRFYERQKLVVPGRTDAGQRHYSQKDIDDIREIRILTREKGVNLAGVRIILEQRAEIQALKERLSALEITK